MWPYLHDEICKITHTHTPILLAGRSCCTWSSNKLHFCWRLRDLILGLQWDHKASWTYTFGLQEPSASGGRKHGGRKNNELCSIQILASSSSFKWTQEKDTKRAETYPLKIAKRSPSVIEKLQHAFRRLVLPDARRFWATFPGHDCEQGVCHKNSSSSCVRAMSNPITHITRILLETERSRRRRKKREKQKLAPYKIYSLRHS
jgi:hypothetical protein